MRMWTCAAVWKPHCHHPPTPTYNVLNARAKTISRETYCGTVMMLAKPPLYALPIIKPISKMQPSTNISGTLWMLDAHMMHTRSYMVHIWRVWLPTVRTDNANRWNDVTTNTPYMHILSFSIEFYKSNKLKIIKKKQIVYN